MGKGERVMRTVRGFVAGWLADGSGRPLAKDRRIDIRCATSNIARLQGLADLGELAVGRRATLVALRGGPEDFPANLASPAMLVDAGRVMFEPGGRRGLSRR